MPTVTTITPRPDMDMSEQSCQCAKIVCEDDISSVTIRSTKAFGGPYSIIVVGAALRIVYIDFANKPVVEKVKVPTTVKAFVGRTDVPFKLSYGDKQITLEPGDFRQALQ